MQRTIAFRDDAITKAALLFDGGDDVPHWTESEYMRGICELIVDTYGTDQDDYDRAKDEICLTISTIVNRVGTVYAHCHEHHVEP